MTIQNEPLAGIQARIEELHNTIAEKEEQIRARTQKLKQELKEEVSPENIIRKHPLEAAGVTFLAGFLVARALGGGRKSAPRAENVPSPPPTLSLPEKQTAWSLIGHEVLHSAKDIGLTFLQRYVEKYFEKKRK